MAREEAEPTDSTGEEPRSPEAERSRPSKRHRAAELFSSHRYRAFQVKVFERKSRNEPLEFDDGGWEDDDVDPPLTSNAPAARAAREVVPGTVHRSDGGLLTPVPVSAEVPDGVTEPDEAGYELPASNDDTAGEYPAEVLDGMEDVSPKTEEGSEQSDAADEPKPPHRSRNMFVATVVGLILLGAAVGSAWYHPTAFAVLLYGFCIAAVIEWKRALQRHGRRVPAVPLIAATIGLGVATHFAKPEGLVVALLVGCAGVVAWRIGDERVDNTLADSLAGVLTLLWIPFLASFLYLLELADTGWERVIIVVLAVVGNDTGALIFGMLLGKHKLLERVSPAKTWEGAIGGVFVGTVAASVAAWSFFDGEWYIGTAVGAACTIAAIVGDLAESALKRDIQVKDMSHALPGHGGILDRIDSLLFAAPVGYVVFAIFLGTLGGGGR